MNRTVMLGLSVFAGVLAGALYQTRRRRNARNAGPDLAEKTRWEGEGGAVSARPADGPVSEAV
jgi:hypothetical protein